VRGAVCAVRKKDAVNVKTPAKEQMRRVRAEHTGGLRRPDWLEEMYAAYRNDLLSEETLREGQRRAVQDVIAGQEQIGLAVVNDGELCRIGGFQESFGGAVTGFDAIPYKEWREPDLPDDATAANPQRVESGLSGKGPAILHRLPVRDRLRLVQNPILTEYQFAASVATAPVKVTLIGPDRIFQRFEYENSRDVYSDPEEFLADVVAIQREMIQQVVDAGCRYVQIDEPGYTAYVDPVLTEKMRARGEDPRANLRRSIRAVNEVMAGFPDVTFGVHICRGGPGGRGGRAFHREGHYDDIAEELFAEANFDRFLIEYDGTHAGTFEPLRFVPEGKVAVLGLVSNHGEVESAASVKQQLDEASRFLSLDQIAICPRCGMRSAGSEDMQWETLALVQAVASDVWG
jgi:5-methyltetrahydropteroyltriglutamate--homocysteine methyltransferase